MPKLTDAELLIGNLIEEFTSPIDAWLRMPKEEAYQVLKHHTGQDFGYDSQAWTNWFEENDDAHAWIERPDKYLKEWYLAKRWDGLIKFYQQMTINEGTDHPADSEEIAALKEGARESWPALAKLISDIRSRPIFQNISAGRYMALTSLRLNNIDTEIYLNRPQKGYFSVGLGSQTTDEDYEYSYRLVSDNEIIQYLETLIVRLRQEANQDAEGNEKP